MKTGRNEPCPCGSNKKYKKCCMDNNIIPFPTPPQKELPNNEVKKMMLEQTGFNNTEELDIAMKEYQAYCELTDKSNEPILSFMQYLGKENPASEVVNNIKDTMSQNEFSSIEEANEYMEHLTTTGNNTPKKDFLGMSSSHIDHIMNYDFLSNDNIVEINFDLPSKNFKDIEIINDAIFFMNMIKNNAESLPLTTVGYLQKKYCEEYVKYKYKMTLEEMNIRSESNIMDLINLRKLLEQTGYIEVLKTKIKITKMALNVIEEKDYNNLYCDLFLHYMDIYDWLKDTRFTNQCYIIQYTAVFSLYLLKKKAVKLTEYTELYSYFNKAFPMTDKVSTFSDGTNNMPRIYNALFYERFSTMFGLVEGSSTSVEFDKNEYKTTEFFNKFLNWHF